MGTSSQNSPRPSRRIQHSSHHVGTQQRYPAHLQLRAQLPPPPVHSLLRTTGGPATRHYRSFLWQTRVTSQYEQPLIRPTIQLRESGRSGADDETSPENLRKRAEILRGLRNTMRGAVTTA